MRRSLPASGRLGRRGPSLGASGAGSPRCSTSARDHPLGAPTRRSWSCRPSSRPPRRRSGFGRAARRRAPPRRGRDRPRPGRVEVRQVLVEAQDVADDRLEPFGLARAGRRPKTSTAPFPVAPSRDPTRPRARPRDGQRRLERPALVVDAHGRQVDDAVRADRPPEVDRLAARADERELRSASHAPR